MKKRTESLVLALIVFGSIAISNAQINNPKNLAFEWKTDTSKHQVDLSEITIATPRDAFPVLDYPKFYGMQKGLEHYYEHEPVIAIERNGVARAYPLNILTMHELSNDTLGGVPIMVTYCPMCNASMVFDRRITKDKKQVLLEFEVSGLLRHNDMIMFDRQTQSWWQQLMGEAIVGEHSGVELNILPSLVISVREFFERYPDGSILDHHTGMLQEKAYGHNIYVHLDDNSKPMDPSFFILENVDPRLPAFERVIDIHSDAHNKIYPFSAIAKQGVINDSFEGNKFVIFYHSNTVSVLDESDLSTSKKVGSATAFNSRVKDKFFTFEKDGWNFKDKETGSVWDITGNCISGPMKGTKLWISPHSNHFAFAYLAFYPDSIIYGE